MTNTERGVANLALAGSTLVSTDSVNASIPSITSSSIIKTWNETLVTPAGNMTLYDPG